MEFHIDRFFNHDGRILMDHNIRVEFIDGEVLSKGRRNKKDKIEDEKNI
jgi:hypothetical protein